MEPPRPYALSEVPPSYRFPAERRTVAEDADELVVDRCGSS